MYKYLRLLWPLNSPSRQWESSGQGPRLKPVLQKLLSRVQFAVFAGVDERDVGVGALVAKVDFGTVEGFRINVDTDGALLEFGEIQDLMDGLERVDVGRMGGVHFVDVGGIDATGATRVVALVNAEILDLQPADRRGHPTILVTMVVDTARLDDLPTDGPALEDFVFEDEIASVIALRKIAGFVERLLAHPVADDVVLHILDGAYALVDCGA